MLEETLGRLERLLDKGPARNAHVKLLHSHIPKTAGVAFLSTFKRRFPVHIHLPWDTAGVVWNDYLLTNPAPRFTTGHITFAEAARPSQVLSMPIYLVTVVRSPLEKLISEFNYSRSDRHPNSEAFFKEFPTIELYMAYRMTLPNPQSEWICGYNNSIEHLTGALDRFYLGIAPVEFVDQYAQKLQLALCAGEPEPLSRENELETILHGEKISESDLSNQTIRDFKAMNAIDYLLHERLLEHWTLSNLSYSHREVTRDWP